MWLFLCFVALLLAFRAGGKTSESMKSQSRTIPHPNERAEGRGEIPFLLAIEHHCPGLSRAVRLLRTS
jgi:hypothetical protein